MGAFLIYERHCKELKQKLHLVIFFTLLNNSNICPFDLKELINSGKIIDQNDLDTSNEFNKDDIKSLREYAESSHFLDSKYPKLTLNQLLNKVYVLKALNSSLATGKSILIKLKENHPKTFGKAIDNTSVVDSKSLTEMLTDAIGLKLVCSDLLTKLPQQNENADKFDTLKRKISNNYNAVRSSSKWINTYIDRMYFIKEKLLAKAQKNDINVENNLKNLMRLAHAYPLIFLINLKQ